MHKDNKIDAKDTAQAVRAARTRNSNSNAQPQWYTAVHHRSRGQEQGAATPEPLLY